LRPEALPEAGLQNDGKSLSRHSAQGVAYTCNKQKLISRIPLIELYSKESGAERESEYVYSANDYKAWLAAALEPLRSASVLAHGGGTCRGEILALQRDCVNLRDRPDEHGFWGSISIRRGLKRKARRRDILITEDMATVFVSLLVQSKCESVFTSLHDHSVPLSMNTLANQHRIVMRKCTFHPDAGLHAIRHTFLTEAGRHPQNVRSLQKLAGQSKIETTMRYIHPDEADVLDIANTVREARQKREDTTIFATATKQEAQDFRKM
jgi:integrase